MKKATEKRSKPDDIIHLSFDVYVDFIFDDGLIFILIKNNSSKPVFNVSVKFSSRLTGVSGLKEITSINLFKKIEFLAPQKEIRTFLDTSESYFKRKQPTKITTYIFYKDIQNKDHDIVIKHNLEIYKDIGYIVKKNK
ncbi:MAG: hypothetical protein A2V93_07570 [Ignavibacteria bacterium RBG_16_34_14]|nr:MAG: hypothetical protein A2V93_07570 [Ignavibacteria bacterium RBG_16_34_14]